MNTDNDDDLGPVEYHKQADEEPEDRNIEEDTTQTADDIVFASVVSGALSEVCEVTAVIRELDDKENDLVKEFASLGCGCDFGPKKTPAVACAHWAPQHHPIIHEAGHTKFSPDRCFGLLKKR